MTGTAGDFTKAGAGRLGLTGTSNALTGATTISAGTLTAGATGSISDSSAVSVSTNATFSVIADLTVGSVAGGGDVVLTSGITYGGDNTATVFSGSFSGAGTMNKAGTESITLSGTANSNTGAITIVGGTMILSAVDVFTAPGLMTVNASTTLDVNADNTINGIAGAGIIDIANSSTLTVNNDDSSSSFGGTLPGLGDLTKAGTGTLTLTNATTFGGTLSVTGGTATLANVSTLASTAAVDLTGSGRLNLTATNTIGSLAGVAATTVTLGANDLTLAADTSTEFAGVMSGSGDLTKNGTGTLTLTGINTLTGTVTVGVGTLAMTANAIPNDVVDNSEVLFNQDDVATFAGDISGTGNVSIGGSSTDISFSGNNTYAGTTTVGAGTILHTASSTAIPSTSAVTVSGTFDVNDSFTIASLAGSGITDIVSNTLTVSSTTAVTYSGQIIGVNGNVTKTGSNAWELSGANTFTGTTTVFCW